MKKIISCLLVVLLIIPSTVALAADGYDVDEKVVTKADATEFADDLKALDGEVSDRLIVSTDKKIDFMGASGVADGIEGLYVLQYDTFAEAKKAEKYYNSLSYINYVEYDFTEENAFCSEDTEDDFDFAPQCISTVNSNIDDAIKLLHKENVEMSEIKVGVIDSGIAVTNFTKDRIDGGCTFVDGYGEDGTDDQDGHGTKVAGTIIQNSTNNICLYSYQILDKNGSGTASNAVAAIYKGITDDCKILNCSFLFKTAVRSEQNSFIDAINYANEKGTIVVAGAGNDSVNLSTLNAYPAKVENAITVGATYQNKWLCSFSNFGEGVDIYATGYGMLSYDQNGNKETNWKGTSAATPVVSSICALLLLAKPDITVDEIKALLLKTGESTREENQTDEHRVIADAYGCVKELLGAELESVQLDYTVSKNEETGCSDISFTCDDPNAAIYYIDNLGGTILTPYNVYSGENSRQYTIGETIESKRGVIIACAYAPGKAKSEVQYFLAPTFYNETGYILSEASATQQYNIISRCQYIDEKTIEVPQYIDGVEVQEIGAYCFLGNSNVETIILPESVKQIDYFAFANCPNLKTVIAPGVEACQRYAFYQCDNLINVELPNVTVANTGMFKNCHKLETAKLGTLTEIDNHAFYGCDNLKLVKTTSDDISFAERTFYNCNELTISTPSGSAMETFANENDIDLLGDVEEVGGSIRATDAGMRLGFKYVGENNPHIEEYGFVYSYSKTDDLTIDNAKIKSADNRIDHGEYTTYNLVFTSVPSTEYETDVSARAYIKIGGEYFYSDVLQRNYLQIANYVLVDNAIDENTKNAVKNIINEEV